MSTLPDKRRPFTIPHLQSLLKALKTSGASVLPYRTFKAMLLLSFFGLFRVGEISLSRTGGNNVILRQGIRCHFSGTMVDTISIVLQNYKHSKGQSATVPIARQALSSICPVRALLRYLQMASPSTGPLFRHPTGRPVSASEFTQVLRSCVLACQLDPTHYTPHSLRIGGATYAFLGHMPVEHIQQLGRWKSSAFKRYLRPHTSPLKLSEPSGSPH